MKYAKYYSEYGYTAVIDLAYKESRDAQHPLVNSKKKLGRLHNWREHGFFFLASSIEEIPRYLYDEGIAPKVNTYQKLQELFHSDGNSEEDQSERMHRCDQPFVPCIYVRELVN